MKRQRPKRRKTEAAEEIEARKNRVAALAKRIREVRERLAREPLMASGIVWGLQKHCGELEELYAEEMLLLKG